MNPPTQSQAAARPAFQTVGHAQPSAIPAANGAPQLAVVQDIGNWMIDQAAPIKGQQPDEQGRMLYLLKCYPRPSKGSAAAVWGAMAARGVRYIPYYGHIDTWSCKGTPEAIRPGYVYRLTVREPSPHTCQFDEINKRPVVIRFNAQMIRAPHAPINTKAPRYGSMDQYVAGWDERIALDRAAEEKRNPKPAPRWKPLGIR